MKHFNFQRQDNNFDDILSDENIKPHVCVTIKYLNGLILGFTYQTSDSILGYIVLKYGEDIKPISEKDYSPVPNVDYIPVNSKTVRK